MGSRIRDRTEDFKDAVRQVAVSSGYDEAKLAAALASFIIRKSPAHSPFTKAAIKTIQSIGELEQFLSKHKRDYVDPHRITEPERDSIETEIAAFIKVCKDQIDVLKNSIHAEQENTKSWLGKRDDSSKADAVAHKHGVLLIASERLQAVTVHFDQLRKSRFQDAINKRTSWKKINRVQEYAKLNTHNPRMPEDSQHLTLPVQQQIFDDETRALEMELSSLLDAVQETETKMLEMSALNHLMSTHVLQQAEQIEYLYDQAIEATKNVERGNKELSKAIERNSSSRTFLLLFLFVLTFSVIFLDWYN